ncbi:hypothetical protein ANANG_G00288060 [Anguilla anguilla]|uniref:Uncharacterized protein n=1 Tax=Anguilla anguilla TaxID=7936 RepID=A0A9D3RIR5_ANGAN|nr:hypothetical protein ANANG_G00288060 [Anguilla anguilla]
MCCPVTGGELNDVIWRKPWNWASTARMFNTLPPGNRAVSEQSRFYFHTANARAPINTHAASGAVLNAQVNYWLIFCIIETKQND